MNTQPNSSPVRPLVFGPFSFDAVSGELRKHGARVRLQGQPLQILAGLIREPGRIVTREEFQQQLWTGSTFVDFEHGLNAAVNRLRQVLGDTADNPRYIETLPGRGYRFVAAVYDPAAKPLLMKAPVAASEEIPTEPVVVAEPAEHHSRRPRVVAVIVVTLIAGMFAGYWAASRREASAARTVRFSVSPPNGFALEAGSSRQTFALSPDGRRLAFTAMDASGRFQLFLRDLDGIDPGLVANSMGTYHIFWAPDGRSYFTTIGGKVRRSTVGDNSYQVVCDTPALMLTGLLLGPNLLISGRSANFLVPASGGTPQPIKGYYPWPQLLPDGKHLLYTEFDPGTGHHRAKVVRYGQPETQRDLLETDSRAAYAPSLLDPATGYLVYLRAGNILAQPFDPRSLLLHGEPRAVVSQTYSFNMTGAADFAVSNNGVLAYRRYRSQSQLAWVNRRGEIVSRIGPANVNLKQGRLSPDGHKIATAIFDVTRGLSDIWIIDAETGEARRTIVGHGQADNPVWAPDSRKLAFNRAYDAPPKVFVRGIGESDPEEAMPEDYFQLSSDWSHDGRFLALTNTGFSQVDNELKGDVWLIDLANHRKVIPLIRTPFHESSPAFSPDDRWLAFTSDESGRAEVYVQAFEAGESPHLIGERYLVSRQGASALRWARNGKELFYLSWDGRVYAVPISLSPKVTVGSPMALFSIDMEARAAIHSLAGFDVSPDGQRLLIPVVTSPDRSEIVIMLNWEAGLRRNQE